MGLGIGCDELIWPGTDVAERKATGTLQLSIEERQ
jgi:hypothetical protein